MAELQIPAGPDALTAEWLTDALRSTGTIREAAVAAFEREILGEGEGFVGQLARVTLQYDRPEDGAPRSLVAKFPSSNAQNRAAGEMASLYDHEIRFYDDLAGEVAVRTPARYYGAMDPAPRAVDAFSRAATRFPPRVVLWLARRVAAGGGGRRYVLLLEDLSEARLGDQLAGCTVAEAELALRHLARLHASLWNSPRLDQLPWLPSVRRDAALMEELYRQAWAPLVERFGSRLSARAIEVGEWLRSHGRDLGIRLAGPPHTLLHGDYRLDNLFFGADGADADLYVIDWQAVAVGNGLSDVAYFLVGSLDPPAAAAAGENLLRTYHSTLVEHGVRDYGFDDCLRDFELARVLVMLRAVVIFGLLDLSHERGVKLVDAAIDRMAQSVPEVDLDEVLR